MICRCIESSERLGLSEGLKYQLNKDGMYYFFINNGGNCRALTKEQFNLYFEVIK